MNPIGHLKTITRHHRLVCSYCMRAGLIRQGLTHDLSKLSPEEFLVGAKYYQGTRSPNNREREVTGVSLAWLHHKGRNKHHFEYWIDYDTDQSSPYGLRGAPMPRRYVAEMIFDRVSASRVYLGDAYTERAPLEYFLRSRARSWFIHEETKKQMEYLLRMWAEKGEDYTVGFIRYVFLKGEGPGIGRNGRNTRRPCLK
ncbi:MAG: DUF5662 family protein [Clostridiales bacterium]|nr:DUF5662 family protein [Clostridiales bacterium]